MGAMPVELDPDMDDSSGHAGLAEIERLMLDAHERNAHSELVALYSQAADIRFAEGDVDAACFYLTHAYVFALETGNMQQVEIRKMLAAHGREPAA